MKREVKRQSSNVEDRRMQSASGRGIGNNPLSFLGQFFKGGNNQTQTSVPYQGRVVPDSFTHGTSVQRIRWFKKGFETGDLAQGDTFNANPL